MGNRITRRQFMHSGAALGAGAGWLAPTRNGDSAEREDGTYREPARDVPIVEQADVVVCGGGPAGVAAAIAAARTGAKTRLLEVHGCLGGIWTAGLLCWILDSRNKPGLMREIIAELDRRGARTTRSEHNDGFAYDVEKMKWMLEEMCLGAGAGIQLHTRVVAAARDKSNRLTFALTESKSGRQAWAAKVFVDATGDGDLAARAGCGFDYCHPETGQAQPMSLEALVTGIRDEEVEPFVCGWRQGHEGPKSKLLAEMKRAGVSPSYSRPTLFRIYDKLFCLAANHEYGVSPMDAGQMTRATIRARAELHGLVDALRSLGGAWNGLRLVATGEQIGVREGRRIHGIYTVKSDDLTSGARFEDAICRATFCVDVHSTDPKKGKAYGAEGRKAKPYDIPLRALIACDVDGLLMAGRCISGDFWAHASYRVTGNAVPMGQAAGTLAALAAKRGQSPKDVPWPEVKKLLDQQNA